MTLFTISAILFWLLVAGRLFLVWRPWRKFERSLTVLEKAGYILFTLGLAFYIYFFGDKGAPAFFFTFSEKRPLSWLLFTWCIYSAQVLVEIFYGTKTTKLFANFWVAAALTFLPKMGRREIKTLFNSDLSWLSINRLSFLLGYSFCVLAVPLALHFFWESWRYTRLPEDIQIQEQQRLWNLDRVQYRLILWALPLLTLGLVLESSFLMESGRFPSPAQIWSQQKESFLALATWAFCGFYLHSRLFFGWRDTKSAALLVAGFYMVMLGHLSERFWHFH